MAYNFDIKVYINSLPSDTKEIMIDSKKLKYIPSLVRFKQLESLSCSCNQLRKLPHLPKNIKKILCGYNQIEILPQLPKRLESLFCNNNQLTILPPLPESLLLLCCDCNKLKTIPPLSENLETLWCCGNRLQSLPHLPEKMSGLFCKDNQLKILPQLPKNLERLFCNNNQLTTLPHLPENLNSLFCSDNCLGYLPIINKKIISFWYGWCDNNPIYEILYNGININLYKIRDRIQQLYNFRHLYYSLKFKKKFSNWLWVKIREPKIMVQYHPSNLFNTLDENDDLDEFLQMH